MDYSTMELHVGFSNATALQLMKGDSSGLFGGDMGRLGDRVERVTRYGTWPGPLARGRSLGDLGF